MNDNTIMPAASAATATQLRKANLSNIDQRGTREFIQTKIASAIDDLVYSVSIRVERNERYDPCFHVMEYDLYITPSTIDELKAMDYEVEVNWRSQTLGTVVISWKHLMAQ